MKETMGKGKKQQGMRYFIARLPLLLLRHYSHLKEVQLEMRVGCCLLMMLVVTIIDTFDSPFAPGLEPLW